MGKLLTPVLLVIATAMIGCDRVTPEHLDRAPEAVQIVRSEFGLFEAQEGGNAKFVPSTTVPLSVDQAYGWVVELKTDKPKVKWREEFTLPSAPALWEGSENTVSPDGKTSIMEKEVAPVNGMISNTWSVAEGDPTGDYVIRLTVEDEKPIVFEFKVQ